ncbi:MAG: cytochrome P450 [Chloroflexota bacterium]
MTKPMNEIPGPEPINGIFGALKLFRAFNEDALALIESQKQDYGDMVMLEILGTKQILVANPDLFREILVTQGKSFEKDKEYKDTSKGLARFLGNGLIVSDGEFWKKQRKLVQPAFHVKRIAEYADTMGQYTDDMLNHWQGKHQIDLAREMMLVTLRIVARTIFDTDIQNNADDIALAMEAVNETAGRNSVLPAWVPTPQELLARRSLRELDAYVYDLIEQRRSENQDRGDLLSMLLLAEADDGQRMSDKEVRDEAVGLFLAGHETTANALNWTFYLLAQNPDVEAKLHEELDRVLGGRIPTMSDLRDLPYTEMVIKESMRWMPPVSGVGRRSIEPIELGGYQIDAGTSFILNFYSVHRDERYWDDPDAFRPERFDESLGNEHHRYAYLPFGGGARVCVGNSFAMMEAQILLATIAQRYRLSLDPNHEVIPVARISTYPKDGLPMLITERELVLQPEMA